MDEQIKEMAEKLAKAYQQKEDLLELKRVVEEIGREGVEKVIKSLPGASQKVFTEALAKAMNMDKEAQEKTGPDPKQEVSEDAREDDEKKKKEQREKDKGEKLVKEQAAKINHQGDDTVQSGEVIKSEETPEGGKLEKGAAGSEDEAQDKKIAEEAAEKEVKEHEDEMHKEDVKKSEEEPTAEEAIEKGAFKNMAIDQLEKGELLSKMIEKLRKRGMDHDKVMDALGKKGYDVEMAKGKWAEMEQSEKQNSEKEQEGPSLKREEVKKSVNWASPNKRLEVSAKRGQNAHYGVNEYIVQEGLKKAGAIKEETLKKSEEEPKEFNSNDVNDLIEKGYDRSTNDVEQAVGMVKKSQGGQFNTQTYTEEQEAKAFNMTVEEMNKILGKPQAQETISKSSEQNEDLEKAGGEGSRGGKVIGRTKTGKPIYDSHDHEDHSSFTAAEHKQAAKISEKMSDAADKESGVMGSKEGESHYNRAEAHHAAANKMTMSKKKAPKPPLTDEFAAMSSGDHYQASEKHYKMSKQHEQAGHKEHSDMHMKLYEAHSAAHHSHNQHERAQSYGDESHPGHKDNMEMSKDSEKEAFQALQESHGMHLKLGTQRPDQMKAKTEEQKPMEKSVESHLEKVEELLK